ncbi:UDP-N-acetylenolpyruvoylglucosamine reductase [Fructobacillus pseudoficulneus]|uniref:UDP-N-acetylenolpyruvoylglucosamine reductase n=1 Tax=Fructobacillus pseudoficulneus TaxID=220714 RepID=A0A3F3GVG5_9LACO|nr:UDP-N-acetylmuramate dehydrogenase [Fructobacillus pseudoficulneus]GAP02312.1 UDP-N-acetylenolpyruvoylglucosamine reductase [Fructobacillus pseudoficulneus]SEH36356.1 UDP-N-acetylmuramate dehydrogenase [Fructobacillus pseudoficulneus]
MQIAKTLIKEQQEIAPYAYTQAGGVADYLAVPHSLEELTDLLAWAKERQLPVHVFGRLSNLVVRSGGLRGLVILTTELKAVQQNGTQLIADAGCDIIWLAAVAQERGLSGLEWSAGIPGSVGGAVFMNAGAYGGQADMVVSSVTAIMPDLSMQTFTKDELAFAYRHSVFQDNGGIIAQATFDLASGDQDLIQQKMDEVNYARASKQPLSWPSNGSVFKRPTGHFAGKLIMDAGLQGSRVGGVEVSTKHAGFMVNVDHGTGNDYEDLIHLVQDKVYKEYQVQLEPEVRILGDR